MSEDRRRPAVTRRRFIHGLGAAGVGLAAGSLLDGPTLWLQADASSTGDPEQLHLQFGADAGREMVASWATPGAAQRPFLRLGTPDGGLGLQLPAQTRTYIDGKSGTEVFTHHAVLHGLQPDTSYVFEVGHDGGTPLPGSFTTAPLGRAKLRFTSFGDQATPEAGNGLASVWAGFVPPQVERLQPLFHLLNGDLCYANISPDRVKTWHDFFENNQVSASRRPWMPAAGNHEDELGNGPIGYGAYQTRFWLPNNDGPPEFQGLWYTFRAGSVRVISLNNDDVCLQDGGDNYVNGYSGGRQKQWLERALAAARREVGVDWVVVVMHQVPMSSVHDFNGADLGIRQEWLPLFDKYGVDLVVAGHEHHYERMKPVRGFDPTSATMRPQPVSDNLDVIDTSQGTVHMIIGGGGTSAPSNGLFYDPPQGDVIMSVGPQLPTPPGGARPKRVSNKVTEVATWAGFRDAADAWGFASFDVDPGVPGGLTTIDVTFYRTAPSPDLPPVPVDHFVLQRPRSDAPGQAQADSAGVLASPALT
ncbi:MAG: metallophosphoesterase family protein [Candidatus Dormibacteraeota bacterium]|nr:metallophosphoesterase family protein [Candidatus Dormibacteraeota bacterium]